MKHDDDAMKGLPPALKEAMEAKKKAADEAKKAYDDAMEDAKKAMGHDKEMDKADDKKDEDMDKGLTESDLSKALDAISSYVAEKGPGRRQALLEKSMAGSATAEEQAELAGLLSGDAPSEVGTELAKAMEPSEESLAKSQGGADVAAFLSEVSENFQGVAYALGAELEKSAGRHDEALHHVLSGILAIGQEVQNLKKSFGQQAEVTPSAESLAQRVPVAEPKSQGLEKSGAGESRKTLSPDQVFFALSSLNEDSMQKGFGGKSPATGLDYTVEASKYEQSQRLSPEMAQEVVHFFKKSGR